MENSQNLFILVVVGIFSFAVATLLRSNRALNRVSEVEKEVKQIEEELAYDEPTEEELEEKPNLSVVESPAVSPVPVSEMVGQPVESQTSPAPATQNLNAGSFPKAEDIRMGL